jgi:enoyl-CoA hydratase/carnithine racemase
MFAQGRAGLETGILSGMDEPLEQAMRTVYPAQKENMESEDYIEGPKAFAEKRKPNWLNRQEFKSDG